MKELGCRPGDTGTLGIWSYQQYDRFSGYSILPASSLILIFWKIYTIFPIEASALAAVCAPLED
jgi:hypothetical protein